jgi:excisionase family DNA binding protein
VPVEDSVIPNRRARRAIARMHPDKPNRRWASFKEAAEYLGVTVQTIRQMIAAGKLRGYRVNQRLYRVDLNELDAALEPFGGDAA